MAIGWVRAYEEEEKAVRDRTRNLSRREHREGKARFRQAFNCPVFANRNANSATSRILRWGDRVDLPNGLEKGNFSKIRVSGKDAYVYSKHVVELRFVALNENKREFGRHAMEMPVKGEKPKTEWLLWGDTVQILQKKGQTAKVMARGKIGEIELEKLMFDPLLEVYFIDVGQGDGVLVRTPDLRHLVIDGGLERTKQQSGKSGADFVDWKFFQDYGDFRIRLDGMMASHSDSDHYGGLHDLIRDTKAADRELDCSGCDIGTVYHPGLARWEKRRDASIKHREGLGPARGGYFLRLLEDRSDVNAAVINGAADELSGPWKSFFKSVLANSKKTKIERVGVEAQSLRDNKPLPLLWDHTPGYSIRVLGPVTSQLGGKQVLKALRYDGKISKSKNTNGHSICLQLTYGDCRILLTGDLNKASMDWLAQCYGDRMNEWKCDVAKACHHGSHDISYSFLGQLKPAATIISSGDAEGHSHPRPEIVGASAVSGRVHIDPDTDKLITPLVYMTEVERSVSIGSVNRVDFSQVPRPDGKTHSGAILGRYMDRINERGLLDPDAAVGHEKVKNSTRAKAHLSSRQKTKAISADLRKRAKAAKKEIQASGIEIAMATGQATAVFNLTVPTGPVASRTEQKSIWHSKVMEKLHFGLVNVRTDGKRVMCATLDETEDDWIIHQFAALAGIKS